jgi:hypothetical protein
MIQLLFCLFDQLFQTKIRIRDLMINLLLFLLHLLNIRGVLILQTLQLSSVLYLNHFELIETNEDAVD